MNQHESNQNENIFQEGHLLLIDKPLRWTSFDVVRKLQRFLGNTKIGHAGTLDPLASGLLIICTGRATKQINEYMGMEKEYTGTITLGAVTATYDLESEPENFLPVDSITSEMLSKTANALTGEIMQVPPIHSAVKKDGKRAYKMARAGKDVVLEPRRITIHNFAITAIAMPNVEFCVSCSTGTYIRSLANDFGALLGCGGYLSGLRRTKIGEFKVEDAMDMDGAEAFINHNLYNQNG